MNPDDILARLNSWISLPPAPQIQKLGYVYDPNQLALSYSRLQTLYSCPRKFQFKELNQTGEFLPNIDTAFGHAWAAGVQELWRSGSLARAFLAAAAAWTLDAFTDVWGKKKDKSLYHALQSLEDYEAQIYQFQQCEGWRLAPQGIETLVYLQVTEGINYQAHIDLILQHQETGALKLVELKTSSRVHQAASWQNSLQTKGYYAFLFYIAVSQEVSVWPELEYHCLQAGKHEDPMCNYGLSVLPFRQEDVSPGEFVLQLLQDVQHIQGYLDDNYFPMRGGSCVTGWGQVCEFFGQCHDVRNLEERQEGLYEALTLADCDHVIKLEDLVKILDKPQELDV